MVNEKDKIYIDWEDYGLLLNRLLIEIREGGETYDGIYGIPRGGWPVAVFLSHNLNLPILNQPTSQSLVVDDISDTGTTLRTVKNKNIATLYTTPWTITQPKYSVRNKTNKSTWLVFPYENLESESHTDSTTEK